MNKVKTTKIGGGTEYAKVADRIIAFHEKFPKGKITTEIFVDENSKATAKAWIWKDNTEFNELFKNALKSGEKIKLSDLRETADANATADHTKSGEKQREKLETVAVGRALAMLGFSGDGNVASSEEMELFQEFKKNEAENLKNEIIAKIENAKKIEDLVKIWGELSATEKMDAKIAEAKNNRKKELKKGDK